MATEIREVRHFHVCGGVGGGAKGFNKGTARVGAMVARPRCIGSVDVDPVACASFERIIGMPCTQLDLFDRRQYLAFHGHEPPTGWREATGEDFRRAAGGERPHIVFMSTPCKGNSGLISTKAAAAPKYIALNELALRAMFLTLEAWSDDPTEIIAFENVPRIAQRSRHLLDQIATMARHYGYAVAETFHDCGELGGLAQSRKRFLMMFRHMAKVPPFLYEPPKRRLRSVGEVLERLPLPGDPLGGPMHRIPNLQWKTWVRLAFVEAGSDWRSLNRLNVADGVLTDYGIVPAGRWRDDCLGVLSLKDTAPTIIGNASATTGRFSVADPCVRTTREGTGFLGVNDWGHSVGTITANGRPGAGAFSIADPRMREGHADYQQYGVRRWGQSTGSIINVKAPGQGGFSVADPRYGDKPRFANVYRVVDRHEPAPTVSAGQGPTSGGLAVADPRCQWNPHAHTSKLRVIRFGQPSLTITGSSSSSHGFTSGALAVSDPRPEAFRDAGAAAFGDDNGVSGRVATSDADPVQALDGGMEGLPAPGQQLVAVIRAMDGTWHRPFTTLELAALQSLVDFDQPALELAGTSDSLWREHIGNMVPPDAAEAMFGVIARTLLLAWSGETFLLSSDPIWVQPLTIALAVDTSQQVPET